MKQTTILFLTLALLFSCSNEKSETRQDSCFNDNSETRQEENQIPEDETVYVCTGSYAKRYHTDEQCRGLQRCTGETIEISLQEAEKEGRTPCKICAD